MLTFCSLVTWYSMVTLSRPTKEVLQFLAYIILAVIPSFGRALMQDVHSVFITLTITLTQTQFSLPLTLGYQILVTTPRTASWYQFYQLSYISTAAPQQHYYNTKNTESEIYKHISNDTPTKHQSFLCKLF